MTEFGDVPAPRFRYLGPLEFYDGQHWTSIGPTKQRALLSLLVLNADRVVPADKLISELWADRFPGGARTLLAGYVWRLRRLLGDGDAEMLVTRAPGYQLILTPGQVDVHHYDELSAAGRRQLAAADLTGAVASFSAALKLWRGNPFADVPLMPSVMAETARLEESRLAVAEALIGAEIRLGRHEGLLPELKLMVAQFPLRERLHEHLMLVLYRSGQQAEALGAYRDLRRLLVDELGIEPSKPLRDLQQAILREDPSLLGTAPMQPGGPAAMPGRLAPPPSPPRTFVGREDALGMLTGRLSAGEPLCVVHGMAGVGKTALALHAARAVASLFPGGCVYLDLRGSAPEEPLAPAEVIGQLLRRCGVPAEEVPADPDAAVRSLDGLMAGRRMLAVLDDAAGAGQVRPLLALPPGLPGPPGLAAIVVSRAALSAVDGPNQIRLGRLTAKQATELLSRCVGPERIGAEPAAANTLAQLCEYLPLALRLAAIRLSSRPDWSLKGFADRLADPGRRLDLLAAGGLSVRASLAAGVRVVQRAGDPAAMLALRVLGTLGLPAFGTGALSALLDLGPDEAELRAASLVDAGLIEPLGMERYRVPELVRLFVRDAPDQDDTEQNAAERNSAERDAARRVIEHYTAAVSANLALLELSQHAGDVLAWYRRELGALRALSRHDDSAGLHGRLAELRLAVSRHQSNNEMQSAIHRRYNDPGDG